MIILLENLVGITGCCLFMAIWSIAYPMHYQKQKDRKTEDLYFPVLKAVFVLLILNLATTFLAMRELWLICS